MKPGIALLKAIMKGYCFELLIQTVEYYHGD